MIDICHFLTILANVIQSTKHVLTYFSFHNQQESNLSRQPQNTNIENVQIRSTKNSAVIRHFIYCERFKST